MSRVLHFFLTSKPYSYASEMTRSLAFYLVLTGDTRFESLLAVSIQTLALWLYFNWQSDRIQSDPGRIRPPLMIILSAAIVGIWIGYAMGGVWGVGGALVYIATICAYPLKARSPFWGPLGPVLRLLTQLGGFVMICGLSKVFPDVVAFSIAVALSVWLLIRNLVGDVRDVRTDVYELPARYGTGITKWAIRVGLLVTGIILWLALSSESKPAILSLSVVALMFAVLEMLYVVYAIEPYKWGYVGHRFMVMVTVVLNLVISLMYGLPVEWLLIMIFLTITLQYCYKFLPGKRFPSLPELLTK